MGHFFVDDSVHDEAGFIIGACAYFSKNPSDKIAEILASHGYDPDQTEFKSSANYKQDPNMAKVREDLRTFLFQNCGFGLVVLPRDQRENLGIECLAGIAQFIKHNDLKLPIELNFDEGLLPSTEKSRVAMESNNLDKCILYRELDSREVKGLQIADLIAHTASIMLKAEMNLIKKIVKAPANSGYEDGTDMELEFEMWSSVRNNIFRQTRKVAVDDPIADFTFDVFPYGLYVSPTCGKELADYANGLFGTIYVGCIH